MKNVPVLPLDTINTIKECRLQKLVVYKRSNGLYDSDELEKIHQLDEAKRHLSTRSDIVFYIDSDDLLKIAATPVTDNKIYLRVVPDIPKRHRSTSEHITRESLSGYGSRDNVRDADRKTSARDGGSPKHAKNTVRKEYSRSSSVDTHKTIEKSQCNRSLDAKNQSITKSLSFYNETYNVSFVLQEKTFSIFVLEKVQNTESFKEFVCRGAVDAQIKGNDIKDLKSVQLRYLPYGIDVTLYMARIEMFILPMYFIITTDDVEYTVEKFVCIVEDLIEMAKSVPK